MIRTSFSLIFFDNIPTNSLRSAIQMKEEKNMKFNYSLSPGRWYVGRTVAILAVGWLHLDRMVHLNNHFTQRQIDINQPNKVNKNNERI